MKRAIETYSREIERYGEKNIEIIEEIYGVDSKITVSLLCRLSNDNDDNSRWKLLIIMIDGILNGFKCSLGEKTKVMFNISEAFLAEFGFTSSQHTKQLNTKYRYLSRELLGNISDYMERYREVLYFRNVEIAKLIEKLDVQDIRHKHKLIADIIHLCANRFFCGEARKNEMVLYYLLSKLYSSQQARLKYSDR